MMIGRLIALYKKPEIIPVGVREIWRRMMVKFLLWMTGKEAKAAYGTDLLAGSVEAEIESGIHAIRVLC